MCGSLIVYQTEVKGKHHELGTSGFLYRANKLMYDHKTQSLWSTLQGIPVVGPLVGQGIELPQRHVVTTTWGQWRRQHPETLVLDIETGVDRDYDEGVAYRDYFATDELKYNVPRLDQRLPNKAPVLTLRFGDSQLAISTKFLMKNRVHHEQVGTRSLVVLTDDAGASRVYDSGGHRFGQFNTSDNSKLTGAVLTEQTKQGIVNWTISEACIKREDKELARLPAHRAFWFGWYAQFPNTRLIQ